MLRLNFPSLDVSLAPLFGGTLISCGWSSAAPRAGALSVFWTAAIPRLSAFQRRVVYFRSLLFSQHTSYLFLPPYTPRCSIRISRCYHAPVPSGSIKILYDSHLLWKNSFSDVCRNGQARSRSINYFHAYRMQIAQSDFIYRYRSWWISIIYMHHSRLRVRIIWNSC